MLTDINQITKKIYNTLYSAELKKIKMATAFIQCASAAWYNDVNKDESLKNLLVNWKVFMLIEFYLPR